MKLADINDYKNKKIRRNYWPYESYIYMQDGEWTDQLGNKVKYNPETFSGHDDKDNAWEEWTPEMVPPVIPEPPYLVEVVPVVLEKHPDADTLSIVPIKGWTCVVKTEDFKDVKLAAYVPSDSVVPDTPEWSWLKGKLRIRSCKLRGVYSQGVLVPAKPHWKEGDNVADELGITKYEPPEPRWYRPGGGGKGLGGDCLAEPLAFHHYTKIQNWNNYPDIIAEGEVVNITEKLHGCLTNNTRILMADLTYKAISTIKPGDSVLGMNFDGTVSPTTVLRTYNNGPANKWLKVTGQRRGAGRGNSYFAVYCTPNHKFWVCNRPGRLNKRGSYVQAKDLTSDDQVLIHRSDFGLSPLQYQVILGKLLGDGYLHDTTYSAAMSWGHKEDDVDYLIWTKSGLGDIVSENIDKQISGYGTDMCRATTNFSATIKNNFSDFYCEGRKTVPLWVKDVLTPIAIAFWYMDDGSLTHDDGQEDRANFAVCAFNEDECQILIEALNKFDIQAVYYKDNDGYSRLRLNARDAEKLFLLVAPYIPPSMQRKLPERYRGHSGWLPKHDVVPFNQTLVPQTITAVEEAKHVSSNRYDIETESHNFFANGVVVHNSNWRAALIHGDFYVGSHKTCKKDDPRSTFWQMAHKYEIERRLREFLADYAKGEEDVVNNTAIILFGEVYGGNIQHLKYGMEAPEEHDLRLFDISINGRYLDRQPFLDAVKHLDLPVVPSLYDGPFYPVHLELASGTAFSGGHYREGIIIKPHQERWNRKIGRVILKKISKEYDLDKKRTDYH